MPERDLHETLAPSVRSLASGNVTAAIPALAGAIASLWSTPLVGAALEGSMEWVLARVIASSATRRLLDEDAKLSESERADGLRSYLLDILLAVQSLGAEQSATLSRSLDERTNQFADEQLNLLRFLQNRFDELSATLQHKGRIRTSTDRELERLPKWFTDEMFPALKLVARIADDLMTSTDLHLSYRPHSDKELREIADELTEIIDSYNQAWNGVRNRVTRFRQLLRTLADSREVLAQSTEVAISTVLEQFELYEPPEIMDGVSSDTQYQRLDGRWRQNRVQLQSNLHKLRNELEALEALVLDDGLSSLPDGAREQMKAMGETQALLTAYVLAAEDLAVDAEAIGNASLDTLDEARGYAWQMAPRIVAMNNAYGRIEARALSLRVALASTTTEGVVTTWHDVLSRAEHFQWHEVRPRLNRLLLNIVWAIRETAGVDTLHGIRYERGSHGWLGLAQLLREGTQGLLEQLASPESPRARTVHRMTTPSA